MEGDLSGDHVLFCVSQGTGGIGHGDGGGDGHVILSACWPRVPRPHPSWLGDLGQTDSAGSCHLGAWLGSLALGLLGT